MAKHIVIIPNAATYYGQMQEINGMANAKLGLPDIGRVIKELFFAMFCCVRIYERVAQVWTFVVVRVAIKLKYRNTPTET